MNFALPVSGVFRGRMWVWIEPNRGTRIQKDAGEAKKWTRNCPVVWDGSYGSASVNFESCGR